MKSWLDPLRGALDAGEAPVRCFFRDDDVGWAPERLRDLLDLFGELALPLDLAVIPAALDARTADELSRRAQRPGAELGLHQHGYAHANHEPAGERKCEFGPARGRADQLSDITAGRERLDGLLGPAVEPVFTPPWNRCTRTTGACLAELGFEVLSREARAKPLGVPGLRELPVSVDWCKRRDGARLPHAEIARLTAEAVGDGSPLGLMFHHAEMDAADLRAAGELLTLLAGHDRTRVARLRDVAAEAAERSPPR